MKSHACFFAGFVFMTAFLSVQCFAEELPFSTKYSEELIEGEEISIGLAALDTVEFTFRKEKHSFRVLGISESSALARADMKAVDIIVGETARFDLDKDGEYDLEAELVRVSDLARFRLKIVQNEIVQENYEGINDNNEINFSENKTEAKKESSENKQDNPEEYEKKSVVYVEKPLVKTEKKEIDNKSEDKKNEYVNNKGKESEDNNMGISINITIPGNAFSGILLIMLIVGAGLTAYITAKKAFFSRDQEHCQSAFR